MAKIVSKQSRSSNASPCFGIGGDEQTAKDRILEVAEELVAEHGPYGFRLQDVADRLNVKPPALYNHFTSRDDLIARLAEKGSRLALAGYFRESGEDQMTSFRRGARNLAKFWYERPAFARLSLWEIAQSEATGWEESAAVDAEIRERSRRAFQRAIDRGEFREIRWEHYFTQLIGGLTSRVLFPRFDKTTERANVETLQLEADDLVVRLLTPDEPLSRLVQKLRVREARGLLSRRADSIA